MAIINRIPFNRRNRFILTASLALGYGATLVPTWFEHVFTYSGNNRSLEGFFNAIELVMETGFAITAFVAMILNATMGEEIEADARQLEGHHIPQAVAPSHQNGSKVADVEN